MPNTGQDAEVFSPPFACGSTSFDVCVRAFRDLAKWQSKGEDAQAKLEQIRSKYLSEVGKAGDDQQLLRFIVSVLIDLRSQGWTFRLRGLNFHIARPEVTDKEHVRASHAVAREKQLCQPAVRTFIRTMEKKRWTASGPMTIFSLMRDGRELAAKLRQAVQMPSEEARTESLRQVIDPYIQIVRTGAVCERTGYELSEIWRYFRHTWVTSYKSTVGRELKVLIRDRATPHHAVIGIGALASPRHLVPVDRWVGWEKRGFLKQLEEELSADWAKWLDRSVTELLNDLYVADFLADGILKRGDLRRPQQAVIDKLLAEAKSAWAAHKLYPEQEEHKGEGENKLPVDWVVRAKTHLYRGNRASALAELLGVRMRLLKAGFKSPTKASLEAALQSAAGKDAITTVLKYVKSVHAGINVLDISICGAVPPYSPILGGKLIAMLLTSPEIVQAYATLYRSSPSIIASAMAGRPIIREPHLVLLTTSSLYGDSLNQYTRVAIPADEVGGKKGEAVRYVELGKTLGQGSHHISDETVEEAESLLTQRADGHRVNSIFGEGVNPRLRKIRNVLDLSGFSSDYVLEHGNPRVLYGVALASNFREILLGRAEQPSHILPQTSTLDVTRQIADYWRRRWLAGRLEKDHVLEQVSTHTLVHPITHGARVQLPPVEEEESPLFRDME